MKLQAKNPVKEFLKTKLFAQQFLIKKQSQGKKTISSTVLDKKIPTWKTLLILSPAIFLLILFTVIPLIFNIQTSFTDRANRFTLQNYVTTFTDIRFAIGFRNSFIYGILVLPFVMIISLVISSLIASLYRKYAKGIWQSVFFMPYITNSVAISLAFVQIFASNGILNQIIGGNTPWLQTGNTQTFNALVALIINGVWGGLAFNILIFTTAMLGIDKNLYKSAAIDGCGGIKTFFTITIPSIKGTINFLITLGIIGGIKVFPLALFQNSPTDAVANGASTIMIYVYIVTQIGNFQLAGAASLSLFIIGIIYSSVIRGGFFTIQLSFTFLGERNVWVKVKNTDLLRSKKIKS
ncbi:sugar ABC transporter permease [Mycoplasmopsis synoviae]|uniref:carbohydrate ABC transporter permease n=1 Tax=Mycoplasmopsis synoviae TaxID=2109 RepID=UPI001CE17BDF|nr:sugar ABC transporter permease [Mycoplasmopsis synoviae]UBX97299.1 sugar ABC transporter permease [Mycoplasmopsis synoviae]UBX97988.1 sugar ABC transporter permease [Mycoplasmopsis synoviae]